MVMSLALVFRGQWGKWWQTGECLLCLKEFPVLSASTDYCRLEIRAPFSWSGTQYLFIPSAFEWGAVVSWVIFVTSSFLSVPTISPGSTCLTPLFFFSCFPSGGSRLPSLQVCPAVYSLRVPKLMPSGKKWRRLPTEWRFAGYPPLCSSLLGLMGAP